MNMLKQIYYWLFPDWKVVEVIRGVWLCAYRDMIYSYVVYEILYSKRLNKYKLRCSGIDWNKHPKYQEAIKKLNFRNEYTSN